MGETNKYQIWILYILLAILIYVPVFGYLNNLPIRIFDESRLAVNAFEMMKNNDWIVTHYDGTPDMWNTKPPLMIWLQVLCMYILGPNELAVRLPSAIATFLTCLILLFFSAKYLKNHWMGFISVLVLITFNGYVTEHGTRTGDYDALLTFFTTFYCLSFFIYLRENKKRFLYYSFIGLTLAVMTKSIAGLLFAPGLLIYSVLQKKFLFIIKNKHFYFGVIIFLIIIVGYYLLREHYNPGYLKAVWGNDLIGRYKGIKIGVVDNFWYYFENFNNFQLQHWRLWLPCALCIGLFYKLSAQKTLAQYILILSIPFFLIISFSKAKMTWYDLPLYPLFALSIGSLISYIFKYIADKTDTNESLSRNIIPYIFLFIMFINPYQDIINKTYLPKELHWDVERTRLQYILRQATQGKIDVNGYYILNNWYEPQNLFYMHVLNSNGSKIDFKYYHRLNHDDKVIVHTKNIMDSLKYLYSVDTLSHYDNVYFLTIKGKNSGQVILY